MDGVKQAFCPLLFKANGGKLDKFGRPVFDRQSSARGSCTRPYDCSTCPIMQEELSRITEEKRWVCPSCVSMESKAAREKGVNINLPGYYTEGMCEHPSCERCEGLEPEETSEARQSAFLQLMIGPLN